LSGTVWTVNAEIYPIHLIGVANSIATSSNWLSNFIVSSLFLTITNSDAGKVYAYLILAFFATSAWFFIYFMLPETKGFSIQQNIDRILKRKTIDVEVRTQLVD
jgi:MFS transporter, SP family, sugar:H+ symporter